MLCCVKQQEFHITLSSNCAKCERPKKTKTLVLWLLHAVLLVCLPGVLQKEQKPIITWSNSDVAVWARSVDLVDQAAKIAGSGLSGALMVGKNLAVVLYYACW